MPFGKFPISEYDDAEPAERPLDPIEVPSNSIFNKTLKKVDPVYAFTINVSPKKYLKGNSYGSMDHDDQKKYILDAIGTSLHCLGKTSDEVEYVFELTKASMIHSHGMFTATDEQATLFQNLVHKKLGFPKLEPSICCMMVKTLYTSDSWKTYMNKDQDKE